MMGEIMKAPESGETLINTINAKRLFAMYDTPRQYKIDKDQSGITEQYLDGTRKLSNVEFIQQVTKKEAGDAVVDCLWRIVSKAPSITGKDLAGMQFDPLEWLADGLIPEGTSILGGPPKAGKSIVALELASSLSGGRKLFDRYSCKPGGKTIYYDMENGARRVKERLEKSKADISNIEFVCQHPGTGRDFLLHLEAILDFSRDTKLVIIDTLVSVRGKTGSSNLYTEEYGEIARIRDVLQRHGASGLILHHLKKEQHGSEESAFDLLSGTTGIQGAVDHMFVLRKVHGKQNVATLSRSSRDTGPLEIGLEFEEEKLHWRYAGDANDIAMTSALKAVYEVVAGSTEPMSCRAIAEAMDKSTGTVSPQLEKLVTMRKIEKLEGGKYVLAS
jgi:hypothetical protein